MSRSCLLPTLLRHFEFHDSQCTQALRSLNKCRKNLNSDQRDKEVKTLRLEYLEHLKLKTLRLEYLEHLKLTQHYVGLIVDLERKMKTD